MSISARTPAFSSVKNWETLYESKKVKVERAYAHIAPNAAGRYHVVPEGTDGAYESDFWRVTPAGRGARKFFGETAWSDAQRVAGDIDFDAH